MLPLTMLPTSESGSFLDGLDIGTPPASPGDRGTAPDSAFAAILGSSGYGLPPDTAMPGEILPESGNPLPVFKGSEALSTADGPDEIVASLKEQMARLFPPTDSSAEGNTLAVETPDGLRVENIAQTQVGVTLVRPDTEHAGPVDEPAPANGLLSDLANLEAVEVANEPLLPGNPAASQVVVPVPPATDRGQAVGYRELPRATAPTASRSTIDAAPATGMPPTGPGPVEEPIQPAADARTFASRAAVMTQTLTPSAATPPDDAGVEALGQPRLALSEAAGAAAPRPAAAPVAALPPIEVAVQDPAWDRAVSERVVMMAANKLQTAEIRLTPAELGPLRVQVALEDGAAQVSFVAQHAVTRDALEQAMPRLREMFADSGIQLGDTRVDVDTADTREQQAERDSAMRADRHEARDADIEHDPAAAAPVRLRRGLVDTFV